MQIMLNGKSHRIEPDCTVLGLLTHLGLEPKKIAVEHNLEIVPKSSYNRVRLSDGDQLEIVQFVGGG